MHNLLRYELLSHYSQNSFLVFKPKHTNPGGCQTKTNGPNFPELNEPEHIIYEIFALLGFHQSNDQEILESFLNNLYRFSNDFPLRKVKIPQDLRSINIVNRLYQNTKPKREEKIWSQKSILLIN